MEKELANGVTKPHCALSSEVVHGLGLEEGIRWEKSQARPELCEAIS